MLASSISFVLALLPLLPYVSAHGFLTQVTIDGKPYQGNAPGDNHPFASPIRQVTDVSPIKGASNAALTCGLGAQAASTVAPANPGDRVDFHWGDLNNQPWIHDTGPMMTYMALCDGSTCDKFDAQSAKWFKIDQIGKKPSNDSDANPVWYQVDVQKNQSVSVTLPKDIAPGDYLIRHEIIALHLATSIGGAEFYPSCTQVRVGGSGSGTPSSTVSFPGGYNDTEPGIFDADIFNPGDKYVFPGPPLSNIASSSDTASQNFLSSLAASMHSTKTSSGAKKTASTAAGASPTSQAASPTSEVAFPTSEAPSPPSSENASSASKDKGSSSTSSSDTSSASEAASSSAPSPSASMDQGADYKASPSAKVARGMVKVKRCSTGKRDVRIDTQRRRTVGGRHAQMRRASAC